MQGPRTRFLKIASGEIPDRLPWFADLSYWHYVMTLKGEIDKKYKGPEGLLELHKDLGAGFYYPGYYPFKYIYDGLQVTEVEKNIGIDSFFYKGTAYVDTIYKGEKENTLTIRDKSNNDLIREVTTPIGKISERWTYSAPSISWAPKEYFVKSVDDLKILEYWVNHTSYEPDFTQLAAVKDMVGDQGLIVINQNKSPLMDLIHWYAGTITTIYLMYDHKKIFNGIIGTLKNKADEALEIGLGSPGDIVILPENLHSDLVGKNLFEAFLRPSYEEWNKKIKASGKYSSIHMDGGLKGLLAKISSVDFSIIEAITPKPAGDLSIDEIGDHVKSDSIMWGGIPGVLFTPSCSDEEFEKFVIGIIRKMTSKPQYVLGIADQIPPDGIIERIKLVTDLVQKYGEYGD